jgi:hypothetical protein
MTGKFIHLDLATLQTMQTQWQACLAAIATAHQSYSIAGRSFTRANLMEVSEMVAELAYAIGLKGGTIQRVVYSDMSC